MRALAAALLLLQHPRVDRADLRAGLDTLYAGGFPTAAAYFTGLGARDTTDPAPVTFEASAYIWWAAALENDDYERARIDSLLDLAIARARATTPGPGHDFWLATALGYRARQRDLHGHSWGAAKDGKAMYDAYARVLAADSTCADCYLGLGVYQYGLARASALARLVAKIVGLGSGNAERGIRYMRRAAAEGDLARVEAEWVLAAALEREAARDPADRGALEQEARDAVARLADRYPGNPVFQRFLRELANLPLKAHPGCCVAATLALQKEFPTILPMTARPGVVMNDPQWARVRVDANCGLRRGAWYRVATLTEHQALLEVNRQRVAVPRAALQIALVPPQHWSVVTRPADVKSLAAHWGERYAVCPGCRNRAQLKQTPQTLRCPRCEHVYRVAWGDWFVGVG